MQKKWHVGVTNMAHYVVSYKTLYVYIAITIQTGKYVHITHNMSTHKFECPMEILTLDEGIYGKGTYLHKWLM